MFLYFHLLVNSNRSAMQTSCLFQASYALYCHKEFCIGLYGVHLSTVTLVLRFFYVHHVLLAIEFNV